MVGIAHLDLPDVTEDQRLELILQETIHRSSNDLQMIIGLLAS